MPVVFLDIHSATAPNGAVLATLSDTDISAFEMRVGENELGSGTFTIRRDHPSATEANLATGNYVKVRIPLIQAAAVFGFWLDEHSDTLISSDEEGGEYLTRKGWGPLYILAHARLLDQKYVATQPSRGSFNVPGYWTWRNEPYGAILQRLIEEGQVQPGLPLKDVTDDFNRQLDSSGATWPTVAEEVQLPIGTDGLTAYQALIDSGELFVRTEPNLLAHAYMSRGTDRTSATYAAGKVRFVKGENILEGGLERAGRGVKAATHSIVVGKDNKYRQVVSPSYVPGTAGRWTTTNYGESNDNALLDKVGAEDLRKRNAEQEGLQLEFFAGNAPLTGRYLPFLHFNTGDRVTLDTGTAAWDYSNEPHYVVGFRIVLGESSDDTNDEMRARSLRWVVELNAGGKYSASLPSAAKATGTACQDCGLRLCHDEPNTCAGGAYALTPSQHFNPLGSGTSNADGYVYYRAPFFPYAAPQPNFAGNLGFPTYGGPGGPDYAGDCTSSAFHFVMVGAGTLTIQTVAGSGSRTLTCTVHHWTGGLASSETVTAGIVAGTSVVVPLTSDGSDNCVHTVVITDTAGACGGSFGYGGADWVALNTTSIVGGPTASSGDSPRAAPCDHDHATVAPGGSAGQVLAKASSADYHTQWVAAAAATTADYLVGTAQAGLSAEIVVGTTPGGELGGTWASPTIDAVHSGSPHLALGSTSSTAAAGDHTHPKRWVPMTIDPTNTGAWQLLFTDGGDVMMMEVQD